MLCFKLDIKILQDMKNRYNMTYITFKLDKRIIDGQLTPLYN